MKQALFKRQASAPFLFWSIELSDVKKKERVVREVRSKNNRGVFFHFPHAMASKEKKWWFEVMCREAKKVFPRKTIQFEDAELTRAIYVHLSNEGQGVELMLTEGNTAFYP